MHEENPGIGTYLDFANSRVYCLPTAETAAGMTDAPKRLAKFAMRLAHDETVGPAQREGYIFVVSAVWRKRIALSRARHRDVAQENKKRALRKRAADGGLG